MWFCHCLSGWNLIPPSPAGSCSTCWVKHFERGRRKNLSVGTGLTNAGVKIVAETGRANCRGRGEKKGTNTCITVLKSSVTAHLVSINRRVFNRLHTQWYSLKWWRDEVSSDVLTPGTAVLQCCCQEVSAPLPTDMNFLAFRLPAGEKLCER